MNQTKPLPDLLKQRYEGWSATTFAETSDEYERLVREGQSPHAMVISCCDSRANPTSIFNVGPGELFMHRTIANLVPAHTSDGSRHGTGAAVEYAVTVLQVPHLVVMGHSQCGGVKGCIDMCKGNAPALEAKESFVGGWINMLRPKFEQVADEGDDAAQQQLLEKLAVEMSLENLMSFPFIAERVENGTLGLHGLWFDIATGTLEYHDAEAGEFRPV